MASKQYCYTVNFVLTSKDGKGSVFPMTATREALQATVERLQKDDDIVSAAALYVATIDPTAFSPVVVKAKNSVQEVQK